MTANSLRPARPSGFTLLEIVVALVVGGLALATGAALFSALSRQAEVIRRVATAADREANGERLLRSLMANLIVARGAPSVVGDQLGVKITSICDDVLGEVLPCSAEFQVSHSRDSTAALAARVTSSEPGSAWFELRRGRQIALRYLIDPANGGTWTPRWTGLVPPRAIAVVADGDTLFLPLGRGG